MPKDFHARVAVTEPDGSSFSFDKKMTSLSIWVGTNEFLIQITPEQLVVHKGTFVQPGSHLLVTPIGKTK